MRGKLRYVLLACAGALLWSVAPALSLTPYAPEAVDFSQPVPPLQELGARQAARASREGRAGLHPEDEGPVRFVSPVIEAPARFDLAGIGGELRPLEYRARTEGGEWSAWVETTNGDPVYFGGADELQIRSRGVRPEGELHYVNVSGTHTLANRILTGARTAVNSALISAASVAVADAAPPQPAIMLRQGWGAEDCRPRTGPAYGSVRAAVVHHTVSANEYTPEEAPGIVLGICRFHRNGNGWNDIGYNFLVDRYGTVYEGRAGGITSTVAGAHAQGYNSQTFGAAAIGTHTVYGITEEAKQAFVELLAWKLSVHGNIAAGRTRLISGGGPVNKYPAGKRINVKRVFGHRRVNSTACPGNALKHQINDIRHRAQARINQFPSNGGVVP